MPRVPTDLRPEACGRRCISTDMAMNIGAPSACHRSAGKDQEDGVCSVVVCVALARNTR